MQISVIIFLSFLTLGFPLQSQDRPFSGQTTGQEKQNERIATRENAILVLEPILDEVRQLEDLGQRVTLAQAVVGLLAKKDPRRCRKLLELLLDDCLEFKKAQSDDQKNKRLDADRLAGKIIDVASKFDSKLAQSLLDKYTADNANDQKSSDKGKNESARTRFYLSVATQFVERDPAQAASIAANAISSPIIPETLVFLSALRRKDPQIANQLFSSALRAVRLRGGKDANELFLLFSFVFSPSQIPVVTPQGLGAYQLPDYASGAGAPNIPLARQYLETATDLILDPVRYSGAEVETSTFGPAGDWYLIQILEPKILLYRPQLMNALAAQRTVLEGLLQPEQRVGTATSLDHWKNSPGQSDKREAVETSEYLLKSADQTSNSKRRDQLFYRAAMAAVREKQYDRALEIGDKISIDYRKDALDFLILDIAVTALHQQDLDRAARLGEKEQDLLRRAFIFTAIAKTLLEGSNKDEQQVRLYLTAAEGTVPSLDNDKERVAALAGVAQIYSRFDKNEAFRCLRDAIRYANKVDGFAGNTSVSRVLNLAGFYFDYPLYSDSLLTDVVSALGSFDFNATLNEVRQLESRPARLSAIVASCKSVLSGKS